MNCVKQEKSVKTNSVFIWIHSVGDNADENDIQYNIYRATARANERRTIRFHLANEISLCFALNESEKELSQMISFFLLFFVLRF